MGNPERDSAIHQPLTPPLGEPPQFARLVPDHSHDERLPQPVSYPSSRGPASTSLTGRVPTSVSPRSARSPRVSGGDDSVPMELSGEVLMDGEPPFDLDMDLGGEGEDESMVSALLMIGANLNQARTYAAAVRGEIDPPTFMEF